VQTLKNFLSKVVITETDIFVKLLSVFFLIGINAFFVAAEFSIVSVRRSRIKQLAEAGDIAAKSVQQLQQRLDRLLSTTQLGITLSSLALGWIGEGTLAKMLRNVLITLPLPASWLENISHSLAIPVFTFLTLAYLQIVVGELLPKSLALANSEHLARSLAPLSLAIAKIFNPFIWILNESTHTLLRLFGVENTGVNNIPVTLEELQLIISTSSESTGLEEKERQLLCNVFEFREVSVAEVMIPRTNIRVIDVKANFQDLLEEMNNSGHARYPVIGESEDDILGVIDFRDMALPLAQGLISARTKIQPWLRPVRFVPKQMLLTELLSIIQETRRQKAQKEHPEMLVVVDEFGGTAGLVTLQDVISEIIGDSSEIPDNEDMNLEIINDNTFILQAQLEVEEVNRLLNLQIPVSEEYQTVGGFLIYYLEKIPPAGEIYQYENLQFTILSTEGPRLDQVKVSVLNSDDLQEELPTDSNQGEVKNDIENI
jgi:CBS domain containing-hemolysin-like protein